MPKVFKFKINDLEIHNVYTNDTLGETLDKYKKLFSFIPSNYITQDYVTKRDLINNQLGLARLNPRNLAFLLEQGSPMVIFHAHGEASRGKWHYFEEGKPRGLVEEYVDHLIEDNDAKSAIVLSCNPQGNEIDVKVPTIIPEKGVNDFHGPRQKYKMILPYELMSADIKFNTQRRQALLDYTDSLEILDRKIEGQPEDLDIEPNASWKVLFGSDFRKTRESLDALFCKI